MMLHVFVGFLQQLLCIGQLLLRQGLFCLCLLCRFFHAIQLFSHTQHRLANFLLRFCLQGKHLSLHFNQI